jgi:hypothetical protein
MKYRFLDALRAKAVRRDRALPGAAPAETAALKFVLAPARRLERMRALALQAVLAPILCLAPLVALAADPPPVRQNAVLTGDAIQGTMTETIYLNGDRVRVDFDGGPRLRGRLLKQGDRTWLLEPSAQRALPVAHIPLASVTRLDPGQPCWNLGIVCERAEDRLIAGRRAEGWRYEHAGRAGPNGTDSGTFWIDAQYGVLLAFKAQDLARRDYRMETVSMSFAAFPDAVFKEPGGP